MEYNGGGVRVSGPPIPLKKGKITVSMKYLFRLSTAPIALAALLFSARFLFGEETNAERLARLNAERIEWLEDVSYKADYTYSRAVARSEEEARTVAIGEDDVAATGFIFKSKDKCRLQILYRPKSADPLAGPDPSRAAEMIANNDFIVTYIPDQGSRRTPSGSLDRVADKALAGLTHSLMTIDAPVSLFIPPIDALPYGTPPDPDYEYVETGDGRARLTLTGTNSGSGAKYVKEVVLRIDTRPATVEETSVRTYRGEDAKLLTAFVIKGDGWKECSGFFVPTRVRSFTGLYDPFRGEIGRWLVSEWKSSGLGILAPAQTNFILKLDPGVDLDGMNRRSNQDVIDIDAITDEDLVPVEETPPVVRAKGETGFAPPNPCRVRPAALVLLGAALAVWGAVRFCRKRRARSVTAAGEGAGR